MLECTGHTQRHLRADAQFGYPDENPISELMTSESNHCKSLYAKVNQITYGTIYARTRNLEIQMKTL